MKLYVRWRLFTGRGGGFVVRDRVVTAESETEGFNWATREDVERFGRDKVETIYAMVLDDSNTRDKKITQWMSNGESDAKA